MTQNVAHIVRPDNIWSLVGSSAVMCPSCIRQVNRVNWRVIM